MFSSFCRFPRLPPPPREPPRLPLENERAGDDCEDRPPKRAGPRGPPLKDARGRALCVGVELDELVAPLLEEFEEKLRTPLRG